jgi:hypothetical protein
MRGSPVVVEGRWKVICVTPTGYGPGAPGSEMGASDVDVLTGCKTAVASEDDAPVPLPPHAGSSADESSRTVTASPDV